MIPGLSGLTPEGAARGILMGKFGVAFCAFLNKHQKGNRFLMERLTGQQYPLKAIHPNDLFQLTQGEEGAAGLTAVLKLMERQQADIITAFNLALKRGEEAAAAQAPVEPAAEEATMHGPPPEKVEVVEDAEAKAAAAEARRIAELEAEREANH